MTTINVNAAPCYNSLTGSWSEPVTLPEGPIELYEPVDVGTEDLPADANFEVEFRGEYPDMMTAIRDGCSDRGRFMWSRPDEGKYLGFLNSTQGSVALVVY